MAATDLGLLTGIACGADFDAFREELALNGARSGAVLETHLAGECKKQ